MRCHRASLVALAVVLPLAAADVTPKMVREAAKAGPGAIPKLQEYLKNPVLDVRIEAVKQITNIGTVRSLDPLIQATQDNDPGVQILATDGLVNFYLPGYVQTGFGSSLKRVGSGIKGKFSDNNDQVIPAYVMARPEVVTALGKLARGGGDMEARANAARAVGVLRGQAAVPDLIEAIHTKNSDVIYQSLIALQKIRDESAAPKIAFLLHDFDDKVQVAAIETTGLLLNKEEVPDLVNTLNNARNAKVKRAALTAIAMLPVPGSHDLYTQYLNDKDDKMRAAAAEGLARLRNPADLATVQKAWNDEMKVPARLADAFAMVMLGRIDATEFSPLTYLINSLNSAAWDGVAFAYLTELAREPKIRTALYAPLDTGTKDEKIGISRVLARSGDKESLVHLQKMSNDPDSDVAKAGLDAVRSLQARL